MSDIRGEGYGDKHNWRRDSNDFSPTWQNRSSLYCCRDCPAMFRHWYNQIPDIFEAMEYQKVREECKAV